MIRASGLVSINRRPVRSKPSVTAARVGGVRLSHSRAIIGPWLANDLISSYLTAEFSTDEDVRRRVAKLHEMDAQG